MSVGSDQPQGAGWWMASDGKWYPPESFEKSVAKGPPPRVFIPPRPSRLSQQRVVLIAAAVTVVALLLAVVAVVLA